jgi:hypothetical protein
MATAINIQVPVLIITSVGATGPGRIQTMGLKGRAVNAAHVTRRQRGRI